MDGRYSTDVLLVGYTYIDWEEKSRRLYSLSGREREGQAGPVGFGLEVPAEGG